MAMCSSSNKLMDEINDQFLVCKICYEFYKSPKTLTCLHTFCRDCLEKHQDAELERSYRYMLYSRSVTCPICRKRTDLPTGGIKRLPDNFLVANLSDVINRRKSSHKVPQCEICKNSAGASASAISKCLDCSKFLCRNCVELHRRTKVTQSHGLFDIEVEKDIICKFHPDEVVRFYCEPCEVCVCVLCTFQEHKGHEVSSFTEGIEKYRHSLDSLLVVCRGRITQLKDELHIISTCEQDIKLTEEQITDMAIESISTIRRKEREMVRDLYLTYGEETLEFIKEKDFIQESIDSLQSTCNLTDIILKDKNVELLLLKKEIQEKLNLLLQRKWQSPPQSALQQVRFVAGNPSFGSLQVGEVTAVKDKEDGSNNINVSWHNVKIPAFSVTTQTEHSSPRTVETTMGKQIHGYSNEQITQTDLVIRKETGTATIPISQEKPVMQTKFILAIPEVTDRQTMTISTPTMKRKIQTDSTSQKHQETSASLPTPFGTNTSNKSSNTQNQEIAERATMTKIRKFNDQTTSTTGLVTMNTNETSTYAVSMRCSSTETIQQVMYNKGTATNTPLTADKITTTNKLIQLTQETNTPHVSHDEFGAQAKMYGQDACVATKTIVTAHMGSGEGNVRTSDIAVDTPWDMHRGASADEKYTSYDIHGNDQSCMTALPEMANQSTFTNYFNMVDNSATTDKLTMNTVETNTDICDMVDNDTKTTTGKEPDQKAKSTGDDSQDVERLDEICQTMISLIDVMLWPSLMPVNQETNTEHPMYTDQETSTRHFDLADSAMNTTGTILSDIGVGDSCCATADIESNTLPPENRTVDSAMCTDAPVVKDQWCRTDQVVVNDAASTTEHLVLVDSSHDAYRGNLVDSNTNTDATVVIKPVVELCEKSTNTRTSVFLDVGSTVKAEMHDMECETTPPSSVSCSTSVMSTPLIDTGTTMNSVSEVMEMYVSTMEVDVSSIACGTAPVQLSECACETDRLSIMSKSIETNTIVQNSKSTETGGALTSEFGMMTKVDVADASMFTNQQDVRNQHTAIDPPLQVDVGVETMTVPLSSKWTYTEPKEVKSVSSYTYVPSVEKATYMPQPVTVTTGTSTPAPMTVDRTAATDTVELYNVSTNTQAVRTTGQETSMHSNVLVQNARVGTEVVTLVDRQNDPISVETDTCATNTHHVELKDSDTNTKELITLSASTTTNHRITCSDVVTETMSMDTRNQQTSTSPVLQKSKGIMITPQSKSVGILKKPHTISRGAGTVTIKFCTSATSPHQAFTSDCGTETTRVFSKDQAVTVEPGLVDSSTCTPTVELQETSTTMPHVILTERGHSPGRGVLVDRASSPIEYPMHERQTSPIPPDTSDKSSTATPETGDVYTSTVCFDLVSCSTEMPHVEYSQRACSPIQGLLEKETLHRGTSMPELIMKDEEMEAHPESYDTGTATERVTFVERASTPIRTATTEQGTSVVVPDMKTTGSCTKRIKMEHRSTNIGRPRMANSSTEMSQVSFLEKETSTPVVHTMHKNVFTENMHMVDKHTNTSDVTAAYRDLVAPSKPFMVTRGTSTGNTSFATKETSPPRFNVQVERGSSPVKILMLDKGVLVKKGEILEPVDTYQSAGGKNKPLRPLADKKTSSLASITEDGESSQDDDIPVPELKPLPVIRRVTSPRGMRSGPGMTHKERFWPATPRMGKSAVSAFSVEGRASTASILCRVETGTNTKEVILQTQGTSTPEVGMADKAVCTESMPVDNKMAECISKLKTVRQRLEQKQDTVYVQATGKMQGRTLPPAKFNPEHSPLMSINMRSKSLCDNLNDSSAGPIFSPPARKSPTSERNSSSDESDSSLSKAKARLARKQRLDITQLLRSASLPEQDNPPPAILLPKPKIQTVTTHVIPKLNIDDFKSISRQERPEGQKDQKKARLRPSIPPTVSDMPPRVPPRRQNSSDKQRDKVEQDDKRNAGTRITSPPPEPPARSASLRHSLLAIKTSLGGNNGKHRKEGSPTKK